MQAKVPSPSKKYSRLYRVIVTGDASSQCTKHLAKALWNEKRLPLGELSGLESKTYFVDVRDSKIAFTLNYKDCTDRFFSIKDFCRPKIYLIACDITKNDPLASLKAHINASKQRIEKDGIIVIVAIKPENGSIDEKQEETLAGEANKLDCRFCIIDPTTKTEIDNLLFRLDLWFSEFDFSTERFPKIYNEFFKQDTDDFKATFKSDFDESLLEISFKETAVKALKNEVITFLKDYCGEAADFRIIKPFYFFKQFTRHHIPKAQKLIDSLTASEEVGDFSAEKELLRVRTLLIDTRDDLKKQLANPNTSHFLDRLEFALMKLDPFVKAICGKKGLQNKYPNSI